MQHAASMEQVQGRKLSPAVMGLGAAAIAAAITVVITASSPAPVDALAPVIVQNASAASAGDQCQMINRKLLVSTTSGSGTVRLREGNYLSPPITLSGVPQAVVFPLPRPDVTPLMEVLTVEGQATDVVITSDVTGSRRTYDVHGIQPFTVNWKPLKSC